jgi:hypothetical protein
MKNLKLWQKILVVFGVFALIVIVLKDVIIQTSVTTIGSKVIGVPIKLGSFSSSIITQKVRMKNLKIYNPSGFPNEPFVDIPEIAMKYDLVGILSQKKMHFPLIVFNLKEVTIIRDKDGKLNVDALKASQEGEKQEKQKTEKKTKTEMMPIQIDEMRLNLGKVIFIDYSKSPDNPVVQAYDLHLENKVFKDIGSVNELVTTIMMQALGPTAIRSAGMYAAATVLGVGFLPAGVAGVLLADDDSGKQFKFSVDKVYATALGLVKEIGELKNENKAKGIINAKVSGVDVIIAVTKTETGKGASVNITARKMMIPKPEIAAGVLHQLEEKLK